MLLKYIALLSFCLIQPVFASAASDPSSDAEATQSSQQASWGKRVLLMQQKNGKS